MAMHTKSSLLVVLSMLAATTARGAASPATSAASSAPAATSAPAGAAATAPASQPVAAGPVWLTDLKKARAQAQASRKPVLVVAGAPWCGWCHKLEIEMKTPLVETQLARYVLVHLDIDAQPGQAESLHIGPIPAMRLLSASGTVAAEQEGYMPAAELASWLQQNFEKAVSAVSDELLVEGPIAAPAVMQLVARLDVQDSAVREAVIRRLAAHRQEAGRAVAAAFMDGRLAMRLGALELLREWKAPIDGIDPWEPATLTAARITGLRTWSEQLPPAAPSTAAATRSAAVDPELDAQLSRLLTLDDPAMRDAAIEQLARRRDELRPILHERLKREPSPQERATLTLLSYRLAASSRLLLDWPGGLERLASPDVAVRQSAVQDLARHTKGAETPLLIELLSDSDALVREGALAALRESGGADATTALTRLLKDPEANVRAAVLKVLAEKPNAVVVGILADYALQEQDPDLVGHAARALRAANTAAAAAALIKLLDHPSWRVRGEAVDGLGEIARSGEKGEKLQADAYAALIKRLEDEDGFVAGQAMNALQRSPLLKTAVEPIVRTLKQHPDLAVAVVETLGSDSELAIKALPHLRDFCHHAEPSVRAAAIKALAAAAGKNASEQISAGLTDPASEVRIASATAMFEVLDKLRETPSNASRQPQVATGWFGGLFSTKSRATATSSAPAATQNAAPASVAWLEAFHRGVGRPAWALEAQPALEKMLAAPAPEEQISAALCLVAVGKSEHAVPRLARVVEQTPASIRSAGAVLPWLPPEPRVTLFKQWTQRAPAGAEIATLCHYLIAWSEPAMLPVLWDTLAVESLPADAAEGIIASMLDLYFGESRWQPSNASVAQRVRAGGEAKEHLHAASVWQRLCALVVLASAAREEGAQAAEKACREEKPGTPLRRDAFAILLMSVKKAEAAQHAIRVLNEADAQLRPVALEYLAMGSSSLNPLRGRIYLNFDNSDAMEMYRAEARVFQAPPGLDLKVLEGLLGSTDRKSPAHAGYLLALSGRSDGVEPIIRAWREGGREAESYRALVYRAVAALNDDARTPVLEEIYAQYDRADYNIRDFYWSIRSMTGPRVLALRKRIRDEVGMERLK